MPKVHITADFIKNELRCPPGKPRIEFVPHDFRNLYIAVSAGSPGKGIFYYRYKDGAGKTCHERIGTTSEVSFSEAKKRALKFQSELDGAAASKHSPERCEKPVPTLTRFFLDDYLPHARSHKRSWKRDEELFRLRIQQAFGETRLDQLNRHKVQLFHTALRDQHGLSPASADHHLKVLRRALNVAVHWEVITSNPLQGIKQFNADNSVEHYLDAEELDRLLAVLRSDSNQMVCMICLYLLNTGCRLNEALQAKWSDIDRANKLWRINAETAKSKRKRVVPLNDGALRILERLGTEGDYDHLFVNLRTRQPYTTIMKVWSRLREKAGFPKLRIHDLRHQFASTLVSGGRTLYEVQHILGHSDPKVTMRYAHLSHSTLRDAANAGSVIV